jgi:hypothetical protein
MRSRVLEKLIEKTSGKHLLLSRSQWAKKREVHYPCSLPYFTLEYAISKGQDNQEQLQQNDLNQGLA